ncbi:GNAT family N-acetyltransferase [bacterium]|nr:GNAT family N-acetyltransferase [bacterium]
MIPHVRKAGTQDVPQNTAFNTAMAMETESLELDPTILKKGVEAVMSDPLKGFYLVSELENRIIACLLITFEWSDWRNGLFWWNQSVYVDKEFRRQGVCKRMYEHLEETVREKKDIAGLRLYVEINNDAAQSTYNELGMEKPKYVLFEALKSKT